MRSFFLASFVVLAVFAGASVNVGGYGVATFFALMAVACLLWAHEGGAMNDRMREVQLGRQVERLKNEVARNQQSSHRFKLKWKSEAGGLKGENEMLRRRLARACELLREARRWHQGDKWRDGNTEQRAAWEALTQSLDAFLAEQEAKR